MAIKIINQEEFYYNKTNKNFNQFDFQQERLPLHTEFEMVDLDYENKVLKSYNLSNANFEKFGIVISIADNIVNIIGLYNVAYGEMIEIFSGSNSNVQGMILNIEQEKVSAIIFSGDIYVKPGDLVVKKSTLVNVRTSKELLGHIINPLGEILDSFIDKGQIAKLYNNHVKLIQNESSNTYSRFMDALAPSILWRKSVNIPLETGIKVIDSLVPIGHGQRELIIGDTKTGKTSIAIDSIINQRDKDTISIYVAIGQKRSSVARISKIL